MMSCETKPSFEDRIDPNNYVRTLGGRVPLFYMNQACGSVDLQGDPTTGLSNGQLNTHPEMIPILDAWAVNFEYFARVFGDYGRIERIGHLGSFRNTDGDPSWHYCAKALDINWIQWESGQACRPCNGDYDAMNATNRRRLIGVEASLRKYFGAVLNRGIDDHNNHFHVDIGSSVGFNPNGSDSARLFIRDCIEAFTSTDISYGLAAWGTADDSALAALLSSLGMGCMNIRTNITEYRIFLDFIMMHAFADRSIGEDDSYKWTGVIRL